MSVGNYDSGRYATRQIIPNAAFGILKTASLAGTASSAATLGYPLVILHPIRVLSANAFYVAGGTDAGVEKVTINKSLAGTGAAEVIGTLTIGTQATNTSKTITITETALTTGDQLYLQRLAGTSAIVADVMITIGVREQFE